MSSKTVAVIGGGNGGHAVASDLASRGYDVRLYEDAKFAGNMAGVFQSREIHYSGILGEGTAKLVMVTSDMAEALRGVRHVFIAVPAFAHGVTAKAIAPHVENGQIFMIFAGTFGSLVYWKTLKDMGVTKDVVFAESYTMAFDTRITSPGHVGIFGKHDPLKTGVMPGKRTKETIAALKEFYPVDAAESVIDSGLFTLNPVVHVPGCVLNAGRIELAKGEFWFYKEGITPCVGRVTEALDEERMSIIRKFGYKPLSVVGSLASSHSSGSTIYEAITSNDQFAKIKGPDGLKNRYYTEDIPFGLAAWSHLAHAVGVPVPVMDALITLGNILIEKNSWESGRKLDEMGLQGLSLNEIKRYLHEG